MGEFNTFRSLKDYAYKQAKFKQGLLIDAAHARGKINEVHFANSQGGVCDAVAMQWLQEKVLGTFAFSRGEGIRVTDSYSNIRVITTAATFHSKLVNIKDELGFNSRTRALAKAYKLHVIDCNVAQNLTGLTKGFHDAATKGRGNFIYIATNTTTGKGHSLAMSRDYHGQFHFFDPNIGEYEIKDGQYDNFFAAYQKLIKDTPTCGWEYQTCWAYGVNERQ